MHLPEGILSSPVLLSGGMITAVGCTIGLKELDYDRIMTVSLLTATFFVASFIHVPLGPTSVHLVLGGLLGVVLGWACFPAILVALFLQAIFFNHGGFIILGVNTVIAALPSIVCFYLCRPWIKKNGLRRNCAAFGAGFLAVFLSSLIAALALWSTNQDFFRAGKLIILAYIPMMIIEGVITMFTVLFLAKVQPTFLRL